jgi:hypothetical protein
MRSAHLGLVTALTFMAFAQPAAAQGAQPDWTYVTLGSGIGLSGLIVSPGAQGTELVVGCGSAGFGANRYWAILAHDPVGGGYDQLWSAPPYPANAQPVDIEVAEIGGLSGPEILVLRADGRLEIWNQATRRFQTDFATGWVGPTAMALADVDADQKLDVVVVNGSAMRALTTGGQVLWDAAGAGGNDVVVAQMDGDAALEAATTGGSVVDCATRQIEWQWRNKFGNSLSSADIDKDGYAELIVGESSGWIWAYDIDVQLPKWSIFANIGGVSAVAVSDIDVDGVIEVLVGNSQWGDIAAYDAVTQAREWGIRNPEHGTTRVTWGDVDGDGTFEVLWGAGHTSTGKDALFVGDWKRLAIEWSSTHLDGPFLGPLLGDVDGDAKPDLVVASAGSDAGYSGGRLLVFDPPTRRLRHVSPPVSSSFSGITGIELVQFQPDPQFEVLVAGERLRIHQWDPTKSGFSVLWELPYQSSYYPRLATLRDVTGDATPEVVVGSNSDLRVFDLTTKAELWKSFHLASNVARLDVADTDFDGKPELHALVDAGDLYVFDTFPLQAKAILSWQGSKYVSVATSPFPGGELLLLGDASGRLTGFFPVGIKYGAVGPVPIGTAPLDGMDWFHPTSIWVFAQGGSIRIHDGLTPLWITAPRAVGFGVGWRFDPATNSILATDANGIVGYRLF